MTHPPSTNRPALLDGSLDPEVLADELEIALRALPDRDTSARERRGHAAGNRLVRPSPILIGLLVVASCADPTSTDDAGVDGGACSAACLSGELVGPPDMELTDVSLRAGWWGSAFEGTRTGITGGFTSRSVDVCDFVSRGEAPGDDWSIGFFLFSNEPDTTGDRLPDPGTYPVIPGWGGPYTQARGSEVIASWDEHGAGAEWFEVGSDGWITIRQIDSERITADLNVTIRNGGGHLEGSFVDLSFCEVF